MGSPRPTPLHGWHHTGDVGYLSDDGFLFIVDRAKDLIITGGFNVYSAEVEQTIMAGAKALTKGISAARVHNNYTVIDEVVHETRHARLTRLDLGCLVGRPRSACGPVSAESTPRRATPREPSDDVPATQHRCR